MSDGKSGPAAKAAALGDVSGKLAEMIASLQKSRESLARAAGPALTPVPQPSAAPVRPIPAGDEAAPLRERIEELEADRRASGDEIVWLQGQIAHTAGLFATLRRLHEAADRDDVLDGLAEAVVSIVGCERFAILLVEGEALRPLRTMGITEERAARLAEVLHAHATAGKRLVGAEARAVDLSLTAIVPLAARGEVAGAIAMEALLPQRGVLGSSDDEVMTLLGLHGALAWLAAPEAKGGR